MDSKGGTTMLDEISSKEKAAILIRTLEEGVAAKVIEYMTAKEKKYYFVKSRSFVYINRKR